MKPFLKYALVGLVLVTACKKPASQEHSTAPAAGTSAPSGENKVMAVVNGENIMESEVTEMVKSRLSRLESQILDIKLAGLSQMIEQKLVEGAAKKKNISTDELIKQEVSDKVENPTDAEINQVYQSAKQRFGDAPLEQVRPQVIATIRAGKEQGEFNNFVSRLRKDAKIEMKIERPRTQVSVDDDPSKGSAKAPIQIVEFSEYQCPFCKRARPTVNQILETYGDKVFYVFRDFPLSFHKFAPKASEAANCAGEQNHYFDYADKLWENQTSLDEPSLKKYAAEIKLNVQKFEACLSSGKQKAEIDKDIKEGMEAGVSGTPAYFINGIFISGAQPFDKFKEIIDEELNRLNK